MTKLLAAFFCLWIALIPCALTESLPASGGMELTLDGERISLPFDADPLNSMRQNGSIQAYFYGQSQDRLYGLYLIFPEDIQPSTFSSQDAAASGDEKSGILLYTTGENGLTFSVATQSGGSAYPAGASYLLNLSDVRQDGSALAVSGTLEACLSDMDDQLNPLPETHILSGSFSFTLNLEPSAEVAPMPSAPPTAPSTLITPADAQKI